MIQQINNQSVRFKEKGSSDIDYLKSFYNTHKHFPLFQQVLIETRTDCNNHCLVLHFQLIVVLFQMSKRYENLNNRKWL